MEVYCDVNDCEWNANGFCGLQSITISDRELRSDGFYPRCEDYKPEDEE